MNNTKRLAVGGLLSAISILLSVLIHFPIIPGAPFLLYDPADIPLLIGAFMMGPLTGLSMTAIVAVLMALITGQGGPIGALMHFLSTGTLVCIASLVYMSLRTRKGAAIGLFLGSLGMTLMMVVANLLLTPIYMGVPREVVLGMIVPAILPFNLLKAGINSGFTFLIYKKVAVFLRSPLLERITNKAESS